ncbi:MAG: phosphoadenosine phosphosulfate reductase family protein [Synergistaceae bacterium]|nr:phosphoadenosine phosphosulfate reductase family protein [Synergistaceae bacterium]
MLRENTLFGVRDKVQEALTLLREHEPPEGYYTAYSGGKDSTVILDLVRQSGCKYDAHYNVTTVDPPELIYFIRTQPEIIWNRPKISMWDLIVKEKYPPTRRLRYCCRHLKEREGEGRFVVTGIRSAESVKRKKREKFERDRHDPARRYLHVIFDWSTAEVWQYIRDNHLPYCSLYDEGFRRLGCICCPMGGWRHMSKEAERWPKYKALYIKAFDRMLEERSKKGLYIDTHWTSGQAVWDWWVTPKKPQNNGQTGIFGGGGS